MNYYLAFFLEYFLTTEITEYYTEVTKKNFWFSILCAALTNVCFFIMISLPLPNLLRAVWCVYNISNIIGKHLIVFTNFLNVSDNNAIA